MEQTIKICLTETAQVVLQQLGLDPHTYGTAYEGESAGLDLYNMGPPVLLDTRHKWTAFGEKAVSIPTGVRVNIPKHCVGLVKERSSITQTGLMVRAGVIDPGYTGEVFVNLVNIGEKDTKIETGAKMPVQLIVMPCHNVFESVSYTDYMTSMEQFERGNRSLGSTNK
jgi:dUTPase